MSIRALLDLPKRKACAGKNPKINFFWLINTEDKFFDHFEQKYEIFFFYPERPVGLDKVTPLERGFRLQHSFRSWERVKVYLGKFEPFSTNPVDSNRRERVSELNLKIITSAVAEADSSFQRNYSSIVQMEYQHNESI